MNWINRKGISILEYILLFIILISAFLIMKGPLQRALNGKWGQTGQSFAFGRQYDPQKSIDCAFDPGTGKWYDYNCYQFSKNMLNCVTGSCASLNYK